MKVNQTEKIVLSNKDRDIFLETMKNPPKPTESFMKAYKAYIMTLKDVRNKMT